MQIPQALHNGADGSSASAERESQPGWPHPGGQKTKRWETVGSSSCDTKRKRCLGSRISETWLQCPWGDKPDGNLARMAGCPFVLVEIKVCRGFVETNQPPALTLVWDSGMCIMVWTCPCTGAASPWGCDCLRPLPANLPRSLGPGRKALGTQGKHRVQELTALGSALLGSLLTQVWMPVLFYLKKHIFPLPFFNLEWCMITNICWSCLLMMFTGRYFPLCPPKGCDAVPQHTAQL